MNFSKCVAVALTGLAVLGLTSQSAQAQIPILLNLRPSISVELVPNPGTLRVPDTNKPVLVIAKLNLSTKYRAQMAGQRLTLQWFKNGLRKGGSVSIAMDAFYEVRFRTTIPGCAYKDELQLRISFAGHEFDFREGTRLYHILVHPADRTLRWFVYR